MVITKYSFTNGQRTAVKSYYSQDITDITKEYMLLNSKELIYIQNFINGLLIEINTDELWVFNEASVEIIGSRKMEDIKNLSEFLKTLESNPQIGGIDAFDTLLKKYKAIDILLEN